MNSRKARKLGLTQAAPAAASPTPLPTITDEQVTATPIDRRRFLSRLGTRSAALVGLVAFSAACNKADRCDSDDGTDADPTDSVGRGRNDSCDSDGT